ncbi:unnamed protein product [Discula destructiva]
MQSLQIRHQNYIHNRLVASALKKQKQWMSDKFFHYHIAPHLFHPYDLEGRRRYWSRLRIPPEPGTWPGHRPIEPGERFAHTPGYADLGTVPEGVRRFAAGVRRRWRTVRAQANANVDVIAAGARKLRGRRRGQAKAVRRATGLVPRRDHDDGAMARRIQPRRTTLAEDFEPAGLKFKRMLGQGGQGAVYLFEIVAEKGMNVPVVVKGTIGANAHEEIFRAEIEYLNTMNGAAHFLQRIHLNDLPLPAASRRRKIKDRASSTLSTLKAVVSATIDAAKLRTIRGGAAPPVYLDTTARTAGSVPPPPPRGYTATEVDDIRTQRGWLDNRADLIVLENMPRGDANALIHRLVATRRRLSDRALWLIFECLFKACVGMATPGRFWEQGKDPWVEAMEPREETVLDELSDGRWIPDHPLVHFDLDPQNALFGDFGPVGSPHEFLPILKVSDPGCARIVDEDMRNSEKDLWYTRQVGKVDHLLPEQFTQEWEYKAATDLASLSREPTAANYNWWSNLYQIGWVMFELITHCFPPVPPRAWPYAYPAEGDDNGNGNGNGNGMITGFTYGANIMGAEFDGYDYQLRLQILRCLDHEPDKRPTMGWLETVLSMNLVRLDLLRGESDEELKAQMNRIFGDP